MTMATGNCLVTNILQNIFFCAQQITGLEQHEGEEIMTAFSLLGEFNMHVSHSLNLPLKHWIHFLLSSLWPPTSNILKEKKNTDMRNVSLLWTDEDLTLPNSNTAAALSTAQALILSQKWTHWKLTLSTWNCVSKIPDVNTLQRSKSWMKKDGEKGSSFQENSYSFSSRKSWNVPGLLEYSRFVLLHQSGQESWKDRWRKRSSFDTFRGLFYS